MDLTYEDIILDEGWGRPFKWFVLASIIFHVFLIYFSVEILPGLGSKTRIMPPIYTVTLVSLPSAGGTPATHTQSPPAKAETKPPVKETVAPPPPKPETTELVPIGPVKPKEVDKPEIKKIETPPPKPEVKKPEPPKPEVKKPETPPPPKPEVKTPPKPAEVSPDQILNQNLAKLQAKVKAKQEDDQINQAMSALAAKTGTGSGQGEGTGPASVRGSGVGTELDARMRDYYIVLYNIVSANWNMPPEKLLTGKKKLEAVFLIRIDRAGRVIESKFERESGENLFDQSAEKAVKRSAFPPLPDVFQGPYIEVGLRFTPSGVRKK